MKNLRFLLAAVIVLIFSINASAQNWTLTGTNISNTNSGNVGIGTSTPGKLLTVSKNMTTPAIEIHNTGGSGGVAFRMLDDASGGQWNLKVTTTAGFKIRDIASGNDVVQIEQGASSNTLYLNSSGAVGIGTSTPDKLLTVSKNMTAPAIEIHNTGGAGGAAFRMLDDASGGQWNFKVTNTGGFKIRDIASGTNVIQIEQGASSNTLYLNSSGAVGIGTDIIPTGSLLAVNGKVVCKEVKVTLDGWADHVFVQGYKLRSLQEVEQYIIEKGHLPGIPSAKEVEENGVKLGEMDTMLLEKIEELTLYVIELQKEIEQLKK